jgi:protein-S-isoprenylcysteine O-methyltransferase Ste14
MTDVHDTPRVVPPPLIVLGTILIGLGLDKLSPIGVAGAVFPRSTRALIGGGFVVAAVWPMARALWRFHIVGTPSEPWKPTTTLIRGGIYKRTRNPMYQAFLLFVLGFAFAFGSDWIFLLLPLAMLVMHVAVVRREERYLAAKFGDAYRDYCARVPRYGWPI